MQRVKWMPVCGAIVLSWTLAAPSAACPGDCDGNGIVRVDELIRGVDIALDLLPLSACPAFDCKDAHATVLDCVVQGVAASINGCPRTPTPSATSTSPPATPTPTATEATPSPTSTPISLPEAPVALILQNQPSALLSISGTSASDVYTVGADQGTGPEVLHYDGQSWHQLETGTSGTLWWISVTPIDGSFYMAGENGVVLRYPLSTHTFVPLPSLGAGTLLFGVWGTDANHIWAVGEDLSNQQPTGVVWRFDGTRWTRDTTIGQLVPQGLPMLYKVWGRNENDLYVVGVQGVVFHFDGAMWTQASVDLGGATPSQSRLFTVHGNASDVVAVGVGMDNALILELQNGSFVDAAPATAQQMNGVFIRPDGAGVAVGIAGALAFRSARGWQLQIPGVDTILDFHGSWIDPEGGVWAVGGDLTSLNKGILAYGGVETIGNTIAPGS